MTEFTEEKLAELRAVAEAATEGPWFYNGYSAILTKERPDPIDGLSFDDWADQLAEGHTAEFHGGCGMIPHCCASCGSFGEYGMAWPCQTIQAIQGADDV